jgi:hypothetical protein
VGEILRPFCRLKCDTNILLPDIIMIIQKIRMQKYRQLRISLYKQGYEFLSHKNQWLLNENN